MPMSAPNTIDRNQALPGSLNDRSGTRRKIETAKGIETSENTIVQSSLEQWNVAIFCRNADPPQRASAAKVQNIHGVVSVSTWKACAPSEADAPDISIPTI